jgi:hypothetical protein
MFSHAVRVFNLSQMRARFAMNGIHEQFLCFFAVFPTHVAAPDKSENAIDRTHKA